MEEKIRAFLALPIDDEVRVKLGPSLAVLKRGPIRPVAAASLHLTLRFFGDITSVTAGAIVNHIGQALLRRPLGSFSIGLEGRGIFPLRGAPRVLWVGVSGDLNSLTDLAVLAEEAAQACGLPAERRPFSPHLTVGRIRDGTGLSRDEAERLLPDCHWGSWPVTRLLMMRSTLRPQGAHYSPLAEIELK